MLKIIMNYLIDDVFDKLNNINCVKNNNELLD